MMFRSLTKFIAIVDNKTNTNTKRGQIARAAAGCRVVARRSRQASFIAKTLMMFFSKNEEVTIVFLLDLCVQAERQVFVNFAPICCFSVLTHRSLFGVLRSMLSIRHRSVRCRNVAAETVSVTVLLCLVSISSSSSSSPNTMTDAHSELERAAASHKAELEHAQHNVQPQSCVSFSSFKFTILHVR